MKRFLQADKNKQTITWFITSAVWLLAGGYQLPQVSFDTWLGASALGLLGIFTVVLAVVYGVARMPVHRSAVILLFELVAGAVSSQLLTDEVVRLAEWLGGGLIVAAAYISARGGDEKT